MPHQQPPHGQAAPNNQIPDLPVHFADRRLIDLRVIRRSRILSGRLGIGVFHVGHVDIDKPFKNRKRFGQIVSAAVIDNRKGQSVGFGLDNRGGNRRNLVRGRDQINIDAPSCLQAQKNLPQGLNGDFLALMQLADVIILAINTPQIAAGKEDRAGAAASDQNAFLAEMRSETADDRLGPDSAIALLSGGAVDAAATRTKDAAAQPLPEGFCFFSEAVFHRFLFPVWPVWPYAEQGSGFRKKGQSNVVTVYLIVLLLVNAFWLLLVFFYLPGNWLMVLTTAGFAWWQGEQGIFSAWTLAAAAGLALLGEIAEFLAGLGGARRAGAGWKASLAAVGGALAGAILGTFLIPIPFAGTLLGGCIGAGLAAWSIERLSGKTHKHSVQSGIGAGLGTAAGTLFKVLMGIVIWLLIAAAAFWP